MGTSKDIKPTVVVNRFVLDVQHPLLTAACFAMVITTIGTITVNCIEARYGVKTSVAKKSNNKSSKK